MRKFWTFFLLAVTGLCLMLLSPPLIGQAKEVPATGVDVNSAVIKDAGGQVIAHDVQLTPGEYTVNYNWTIANDVVMKSGDTMTFTLPPNVYIPADDDFTAYTTSGIAIGTIHIGKGSSTGVMTFNRYFQYTTLNRRGWLKINVPVTAPPAAPISMSKTASWADPSNPTVINWQLTVNPAGNTLTNPVIKDNFSNNQTYVAGSVRATAAGQAVPVTASGSLFNNTMTFKLSGSYTSAIILDYQTKTTSPTGAATFSNNATYTDSGGHQANATADIAREDEPSNPGPSEPEPQDPIAMAKSVSWADPQDQTKLNWAITVKANKNQLVNPQIIDHLSANQAYVPRSAKMTTANGQNILVAASISGGGRSIVFKAVGTYTTDIHLTYQSEATLIRTSESFTNNATYSDDAGHQATATAEATRTIEPAKPPVTMTKTVGWADPDDQTKLNWNLAISSNGNQLINPTITDRISPNQTFIAGSAIAITDNDTAMPVTATANGSEITFKIPGTYTTDFQLAYQTRTNDPMTPDQFTNAAVYEDDAGNQASANAAINRELDEDPEEPDIPISMSKAATWSDPSDPTKINWALTIKPNTQVLRNPMITDQLSDNQTYVDGSVTASDAKGTIPVTASVKGTQLTFKLTGKFLTDLKLMYQTTTNDPQGTETFTNTAVVDDDANNHAEANTSIDRESPAVEPVKDPISLTKTATWRDPLDPTQINWQLTIKTNGNTLKNPVVTDVLSDNQTYVTDSAKAVDATGHAVPLTATANGQTLTIKFTGALTSDLTVTYQTTTNTTTGAATFDNAAVVDDDNGNHAGGGSSVSRENPPAPTKTPIDIHKVAAWNDPNDQSTINWTIAITANGNELSNPVITDVLSNNQTYIVDSAKAVDETGQALPLTVTVTDHTLTFKLAGTFTHDFTLTYQTKTSTPTGAAIFDNAAIYTDDNDNNGSTSTEIDRPDITEPGEPGEPEQPGQPEQPGEPEQPGKPENPGQPEQPGKPENPGQPEQPSKPENPGVTAPTNPGTEPTVPETTTPVSPVVPAPTKPSKPVQSAPVPVKPVGTLLNTNQLQSKAKASPRPYNSVPGRLPQTDEHRNATLNTLLGALALIAGLGLGYLDFRRHQL